jgi:hypothetical protein
MLMKKKVEGRDGEGGMTTRIHEQHGVRPSQAASAHLYIHVYSKVFLISWSEASCV